MSGWCWITPSLSWSSASHTSVIRVQYFWNKLSLMLSDLCSTALLQSVFNSFAYSLKPFSSFSSSVLQHLAKDLMGFYSTSQCSHCKRCTSYSNSVCLSVCLSIRPSHAGIVSKRRHVARCSLHCQIAKCVLSTTPSP